MMLLMNLNHVHKHYYVLKRYTCIWLLKCFMILLHTLLYTFICVNLLRKISMYANTKIFSFLYLCIMLSFTIHKYICQNELYFTRIFCVLHTRSRLLVNDFDHNFDTEAIIMNCIVRACYMYYICSLTCLSALLFTY